MWWTYEALGSSQSTAASIGSTNSHQQDFDWLQFQVEIMQRWVHHPTATLSISVHIKEALDTKTTGPMTPILAVIKHDWKQSYFTEAVQKLLIHPITVSNYLNLMYTLCYVRRGHRYYNAEWKLQERQSSHLPMSIQDFDDFLFEFFFLWNIQN